MEMYLNSFTSITVGGKNHQTYQNQLRHQKGCPLSPLLFNVMLDEETWDQYQSK